MSTSNQVLLGPPSAHPGALPQRLPRFSARLSLSRSPDRSTSRSSFIRVPRPASPRGGQAASPPMHHCMWASHQPAAAGRTERGRQAGRQAGPASRPPAARPPARPYPPARVNQPTDSLTRLSTSIGHPHPCLTGADNQSGRTGSQPNARARAGRFPSSQPSPRVQLRPPPARLECSSVCHRTPDSPV